MDTQYGMEDRQYSVFFAFGQHHGSAVAPHHVVELSTTGDSRW